MLAAILCNLAFAPPVPVPTPVPPGGGSGSPVRPVERYDLERLRLVQQQKRDDDEMFAILMALMELELI